MIMMVLMALSINVHAQWTLQANPDSAMLGKIQFVSASEGWINCGSNGGLLHTTDGGTNWNKVTPFPNDTVGAMSDPAVNMSWVNPTHGWVLKTFGATTENANYGKGGVLYRTQDGGSTWSRNVFPKSMATITYSKADLQGAWQMHELVASKSKEESTVIGGNATYSYSWAGWVHCLINIDANGTGTFSGMINSSGASDSPYSVPLKIDSEGNISIEDDFHGFLSTDKSIAFFTMTDGDGGFALAVMQKQVAGITYSVADLQGTWQLNSLTTANSSGFDKKSGLLNATLTLDENGTGTVSFMEDNVLKSQSLTLAVTPDGVVTMNGTDCHGFMSADKKFVSLTMTEDEGNGYNLMTMQKVATGISYATSDLKGLWQAHMLYTPEYSFSQWNKQASWSHGLITLNSNGEGSGSFISSRNNNDDEAIADPTSSSTSNDEESDDSTIDLSFFISSDGVVTSTDGNLHGYMSADKSTIILTMTDQDGSYVLATMQKDLAVSGDIGLQVQFADENYGWASIYNMIYGNFQLYKTTDGGSVWNSVSSNAGGFYQFLDANNGWMAGVSDTEITNQDLNNIYRTSDGGITWTLQASNVGEVNALFFSDLLHGWVVGANGLILKTIDGGTHWTAVTNTGLSSDYKSKCVYFLDANNGWIGMGKEDTEGVGTRFILATTDGGASWKIQPTPVTNSIFSISFWDAANGWFTSDKGQIAHYVQPKTVTVEAGGLFSALSPTERSTTKNLCINGTLDARDFKTMRDSIPLLSYLDISGVNIVAYSGTEGTYRTITTDYPANTVPRMAFCTNTGLTNLSTVLLPPTLTAIGRSAFNRCTGLNSINIPSTVSSIGYAAFRLCNLNSVNLPSSVTLIDTLTFSGCSNLTSITIPSAITFIGNSAFSDCVKLESVSFESSSSLTTIEARAFLFCTALNSFEITPNVTSIGYIAFSGTNANIIVDSENTSFSSVDGVLFNKEKSEIIYVPSMKSGSFEIPSTVSDIGADAFYNCSQLNTIIIPASVSSIEPWAFEGCSGLSELYVYSATPVDLSASDSVFNSVGTDRCTLYVPSGSKALYQEADQWRDFVNIQEFGNVQLKRYTELSKVRPYYIIGMGDGKWNNNVSGLGVSFYPMGLVAGEHYNDAGDGIFTYAGYFRTTDGFKLIRDIGSWAEQWGMSNGNFAHNDDSSSDIKVSSDGFYTITLNSIDHVLNIAPLSMVPNQYTTVSLIGSFNQWLADLPMTPVQSVNNHEWYKTFQFSTDGECKFRAENTWGINWGASEYPFGLGFYSGPNIPYKAGTYHIFLNDIDYSYYFVSDNELANSLESLTSSKDLLYPNPTTDGFYVCAGEKTTTVTICDLKGSLLLSKQVSGNSFIDVRFLPQGVYLVKVPVEGGLIISKLIKK